jgi:uncharacterized membrane protein YtjA (UPF0391 family)
LSVCFPKTCLDGPTANPRLGYRVAGIGPVRGIRYKDQVARRANAAFDSVTRDLDAVQGGFMLRWALIFFVVALVAAVFGFLGIAVAAAGIARILFFIFLVLFLVSLVSGLLRRA